MKIQAVNNPTHPHLILADRLARGRVLHMVTMFAIDQVVSYWGNTDFGVELLAALAKGQETGGLSARDWATIQVGFSRIVLSPESLAVVATLKSEWT